MKMMRCKAQITIATRSGPPENLQPGMEVNFDRVLNPATGFTVGDAVEGREDCFEPVTAVSSAPVESIGFIDAEGE